MRMFSASPARSAAGPCGALSPCASLALLAGALLALWAAAGAVQPLAFGGGAAGAAAAAAAATIEAQAAQLTRLEGSLRELEARHSRIHLDMSQAVQQLVSDQYANALSGPLALRHYPPVLAMPAMLRKRILVTGGAGFVGSHLVDALMTQGHYVYVLDNLFTGRQKNIEHWMGHPNFNFYQHDVVQPFYLEVDQIYHLACPASPPHYQYNVCVAPLTRPTIRTHPPPISNP